MGNVLNQIIFQPPRPSTYDAGSLVHMRQIKSQGEKICVTVHQSATYAAQDSAILVLYSHGNAEDLGEIDWFLAEFCCELGKQVPCIVVGYDYCGYGMSTGSPSESAVFQNATDVLQYAMTEYNIPHNRVVVWGRSLGSGPACYLANRAHAKHKKPFLGVVLQSPLMSAFRVGLRSTSKWKLPMDQFRNYERARQGFGDDTKIFIIHGQQDEVVPFLHGKTLHETLPQHLQHPPLFVPKAGHNDVEERVKKLRETRDKYPTLGHHVIGFIVTCATSALNTT